MSRQLIRAPKMRPLPQTNESFTRDVVAAARLSNGTRRFAQQFDDEDEYLVEAECCPRCGDYTGDGEPCSFCADDEDDDHDDEGPGDETECDE